MTDGVALPPPKQVGQARWLVAAIVLGCAGSLAGLALFATDNYTIGVFEVELSAKAASEPVTELEIRPSLTGISAGHTETRTHSGYLAFRATVLNLKSRSLLPLATKAGRDPQALANYLRDEGKSAGRAFGIRAGLAALLGGMAGGGVVALFGMRPRRMIQGGIAGLVLVAILGVIAWQTYDIDTFAETTFTPASLSAR